MSRSTRTRRAGALLLAGALLAGLSVTAAPALAAPPKVVAQAVNADSALIDPNATGSVSIHSYIGIPLDQAAAPANGTQIAVPVGATPLSGAVYTVSRVNGVDLTSNAGWQLAASYHDNIAQAQANLGATVTSAPTNAAGLTVVNGLPIGLYLVHEATQLNTGAAADASLTRVRDFLITVPLTDPAAGNSWLYDLHVYPKRERLQLTKTVLETSLGSGAAGSSAAGRVITYGLDAGVPTGGVRAFGGRCERSGAVDSTPGLDPEGFTTDGWCATGATYVGTGAGGNYSLVDDLAANQVPGGAHTLADYLELTGPGWAGKVTVGLTGGTALTACPPATSTGCDYQLVVAAGRLEVRFTDAGMLRLAKAKQTSTGTRVEVEFDARVSDAGAVLLQQQAASGQVVRLPNTARLFANGVAVASNGPLDSNTATITYAALRLHKLDAASLGNLAGAVFTIYRTQADAKAGSNALAVTGPTDANGMATAVGLIAADDANSAQGSYWLTETTVPTGYVGLSAPIKATLLPDGSTLDADASGGLPVLNQKQGSPSTPGGGQTPGGGKTPGGKKTTLTTKLARTGAELAPVLAVGLILIGVGVPLVRRRRRDDDAD